MSKTAIQIKGLSKAYMIGHEREAMVGTMTFRDSLVNIARKPYELFTGRQLKKEKFWALKDVNLNIDQGDVVGIIGRNGSGKSTMLKVLSRIVEPTKGEVIMRGRVASLLEVGTGFHPELTGRENVFFNGAILGMSRKEIKEKFDEIVTFSEVEKFLDTPVKFYSSGMYVRLAFAVAAHLDPDILIVDEVLAVGDAGFQKKCLGKMKDVAGEGRTVIFVSHSMDMVSQLCTKAVWMSGGEMQKVGATEEIIKDYVSTQAGQITSIKDRKDRRGSQRAQFVGCKIKDNLVAKKELEVELEVENKTGEDIKGVKLSLDLFDDRQNHLANLTNSHIKKELNLAAGKNKYKVIISNVNVVPGSYFIGLFLATDLYNAEILDWVDAAAVIPIGEYDYYGLGEPPQIRGRFIYMDFKYDEK